MIVGDRGGLLIFGGKLLLVSSLVVAFAMEQHFGAMAWCANEASEGLMNAAHSGDDINICEGL